MPHEIDETTGRAAIFTTGQPAWHGLGQTVEEAQTSAEAIGLAGLDWSVEQFPVFAKLPAREQELVEVPRKVANVRTDTNAVLGVVGEGYRVFQNSEAFEFFDTLVGDRLAIYETAGSLHGGRTIWVLAKLPNDIRVVGDDEVKPYVLLVNGHDGGMSLKMLPTTVRVVCANTLNLALSGGRVCVSIPHYPRLDQRVTEARTALSIFGDRLDEFADESRALAAHQLSTLELVRYFSELFPTADATERTAKRNNRIVDQLRSNFENERNHRVGVRGSAWAAFNSVSEYADHQRPSRGRSPEERRDNQLASVFFGSANALKQRAWTGAMELLAV